MVGIVRSIARKVRPGTHAVLNRVHVDKCTARADGMQSLDGTLNRRSIAHHPMNRSTGRSFLTAFLTVLASASLPAQSNDDCTGVTPLPIPMGGTVTFNGDNTGATITGDFLPGSLLDLAGVPVVWHAFTTDNCSNLTISYCGSPSVFVDFWNVLLTTCPGSNQMVVTQSYNYTACGDGNPTMLFSSLPAGTYYYPVWTEAGTAEGPYTLQVTALSCGVVGPPPNDNCNDVAFQPLVAGATLTFSGDNTNATDVGDWLTGSPFAGAFVVWHAFSTTTCTNVRMSYCGMQPTWNGTFGFLTTTCPGGLATWPSAFNNTFCADGNATYGFIDLPPGNYYVPVLLEPNANSVGAYTIQLLATACSSVPPVNDSCATVSPVDLFPGQTLTFSGNNTLATADDDLVPGSNYPDAELVWHAFTTAECTDVTVSYCGQTPAWTNVFPFLATSCPADQLVQASGIGTSVCGDGNTTLSFPALPAGTYYLPVLRDPQANAVGAYFIQVQASVCAAPAPPNDRCVDVTPEALPMGGSLSYSGDNTQATADDDWAPGSPFAGQSVVWHAFTTTECADVELSYCGQVPAWGNVLGILGDQCPMDPFVVFTGWDDTTCADGNIRFRFDALPEGTWYIPVLLDASNDAVGPYTIEVAAEACLSTGIRDDGRPSAMVMPNPHDGRFTVVIRGMDDAHWLEVLDMTGRLVHARSIAGNTGRVEVDAQPPGPGLYVLRISSATDRLSLPMMVR